MHMREDIIDITLLWRVRGGSIVVCTLREVWHVPEEVVAHFRDFYLFLSILADTCAGTTSSKVPVESKTAETGRRC